LVEAMKLLWSRGSKAWLVMAGPSLSTFDDYLAANAGDSPRLVNLPPFEDEAKRDLLAGADLVVQPSRVESLGLVVLEAWANAKPVIAADIAVSRELVNSTGGGMLVPFGDSSQLAEAIETLLADPELRAQMGRHGQKKALSEYQQSYVSQRNLEEFEGLMAERAARRR
jgi:glycogen synthase